MLALRKAVLERKGWILSRNLINLFKHLRCWSLYRWRKYLKRCLVVQNLKMTWSRRFIPKLFVWHSSRDIVRMKRRYYRAGLYTEKKRSRWLKQWPIRKGSNVSTRSKLHLQPMTTRLFLSP